MAGPTGRFHTPWASDRRAHGLRVDHRWRRNLPSAASADEALRLVVAGCSRSSADQFASQLAARSSQPLVRSHWHCVLRTATCARSPWCVADGASFAVLSSVYGVPGTQDCGLRTADCGLRTANYHHPLPTLSAVPPTTAVQPER
jgi:hypothetical protein